MIIGMNFRVVAGVYGNSEKLETKTMKSWDLFVTGRVRVKKGSAEITLLYKAINWSNIFSWQKQISLYL